jgi:hypothetical protein
MWGIVRMRGVMSRIGQTESAAGSMMRVSGNTGRRAPRTHRTAVSRIHRSESSRCCGRRAKAAARFVAPAESTGVGCHNIDPDIDPSAFVHRPSERQRTSSVLLQCQRRLRMISSSWTDLLLFVTSTSGRIIGSGHICCVLRLPTIGESPMQWRSVRGNGTGPFATRMIFDCCAASCSKRDRGDRSFRTRYFATTGFAARCQWAGREECVCTGSVR